MCSTVPLCPAFQSRDRTETAFSLPAGKQRKDVASSSRLIDRANGVHIFRPVALVQQSRYAVQLEELRDDHSPVVRSAWPAANLIQLANEAQEILPRDLLNIGLAAGLSEQFQAVFVGRVGFRLRWGASISLDRRPHMARTRLPLRFLDFDPGFASIEFNGLAASIFSSTSAESLTLCRRRMPFSYHSM